MKLSFTITCWLLTFTLHAQVSINTNCAAPVANTMLEIGQGVPGKDYQGKTMAEYFLVR